jgi:amino acid adenylation domain-containing protein
MARTSPAAAFLISPETGRVLTFQGLQEQSRLLSIQLREAGLEQGGKVAFLLDNGLFTAQLFLGTMYGGFVSVPLNVRAGVSSLSYTLDHCDAKVVFVGGQYAALIKEVLVNVRRAVQVIPADVDGFAVASETPASSALLSPLAPEDEALLMYTSGSTGQPKAAMHTHRTVLAHGRNSICSHQLSAADRSLLVLPLYHINAECVTLVPTLLSGGSLVVPHAFSVSQFWNWLDDYRCTWSALVPTIISQLLDWKDPRADSRQAAFQRIRFLRSSSAPLSPSLHREFLDKFKLLLIQAMGSTEAGNIFSNPLPPGANKIGSPGLPWGFETKILNQAGGEAPAGESGEVFIRGPALMRGYYKDPDGTAAVLDPDGWFRTGDLAYRDPDGYFFVVGRSKELIIKGGVNIAPKQIDEVIESHPAVLEAAAVGVPDRYVGEDLVAFVVLRSGMTTDERELLTFCESRLGHFKTPTRIHFVEDLPKGPSGKVQRLKLQEKATQPSVSEPGRSEGEGAARGDGQAARTGSVAPSTPIEQTIAVTWAELLAKPQIDLHANFFSLGGHSLLAIQCLSRLREKLPIVLSLSDFFENATVAQQAALIRKRLRPADSSTLESTVAWEHELLLKLGLPPADPPIPLRDRSLPCPLSPNQRRIWFMEQLNSGVPVYNESEAVRLRGDLNIGVLEKAFNVIIARHEILRTTIQAAAEESQAIVHESWPLRFKQIDLSSLAPARRDSEVERLLIDEPRLPYHLETEPGIRVTLLRLGPQEHVFILMMHHLICDWASEGVLWRELSALYRAGCRDQQLDLPPLPLQHGDYAAWQQQQMARKDLAEDLEYWAENLRGAPALLELPTDRPRSSVNSFTGARRRFRIPSELVPVLRDCSQREKVSLFTVFTAALDALLYRYTGQEDILLGIPLADRDRPGLQSMIGFLLHTHVLRTQLAGDLSFRELLARVQKGVLDLYAHRSPPFEQVVSQVQSRRSLSYSPLFQVMINWRDRDQQLSFIGMEGLAVESLLAETRTSKFDLTLMLTDDLDDIWLEMEYSTDLFDEARIERMVGHYQTLLQAVAADSDRLLSDLPMLTDAERQQLLVEWNRTVAPYPKDRCLHELIEEQARRTPEAVAVVFDDKQLTYGQLNERANQLAHRLQKLGVGPDTLVGVCVERSLEMMVTLLGILKAGGAYLPLDPTYPKERLAFMLEDSGVGVLLTQASMAESLPTHQAQIVRLDADWSAITAESPANPRSSVAAHHLAYMIYTSGSTGKPKGVQIQHGAVVNFLHSMRLAPGFTAQDKLLAITTLSFDIAGLELWLPLIVGAQVVIASRETARDGQALRELLARCEATVMQATPSTWKVLLSGDWRGNPHLKILCGGEPWPRDLARQLLEKCGSVWNMYGPTETTIWSAACNVRAGEEVLIGGPIANTQFYVLDHRLRSVPVGIAGELWIGGDGLARGYFKRPELTREKFIHDPFYDKPAARMYKTGDLVRWQADGKIEFLGRTDHQVKIRGFRIELGEIESVLAGHPGVREAVVVVREDHPGDRRLVAYLTAKDGLPPTDSELRGLLLRKLPEYMVPFPFVILDALPLTPNGKVDRNALPAPQRAPAQSDRSYVAPRTPLEESLAGIWAEVLRIERVGIKQNFFDLGGHSLLAVRLQARVEKELGRKLPLAAFFLTPTVEGLASLWAAETAVAEAHRSTRRAPAGQETLFCFHFLNNAQCLAKFLEPKWTVCFVESPFDEELRLWHEHRAVAISLEELAGRCLAYIRRVQPRGPYNLVGWCFGGVLAFEVASQLTLLGEKVALLAMLDAFYFPGLKRQSLARMRRWVHDASQKWDHHVWKRGIYHTRQIFQHGISYCSTTLRRKLEGAKKRRSQLAAMRADRRRLDDNESEKIRLRQVGFVAEIQRAYNGKPYAGDVVIIRRSFEPLIGYDPSATNGWEAVIQGHFQVEELGCKHDEFFEKPHINTVVSWLDNHLSKAHANLHLDDQVAAAPQLRAAEAERPRVDSRESEQ